MNKTQLVQINIADLKPAEWNYKTDGTEEQIEKLAASIKEDSSAGVLAVREVDGKFEVIDGNHRLKAVKNLKWQKVPCENFGDISKAKAIIVSRRRNTQWFEDDTVKYAEIFRDDVLQEYSLDDLEKIMPESREDMENLAKLLDFDWEQYGSEGGAEEDKEGKKAIKFKLTEEMYLLWRQWCECCEQEFGITKEPLCFKKGLEMLLQ